MLFCDDVIVFNWSPQGKLKQMKLSTGKGVVTSKSGGDDGAKEPPKKKVRLVHEEDELEESECVSCDPQKLNGDVLMVSRIL